MDDDDFTPRLGRLRARTQSFRNDVLRALARNGGRLGGSRSGFVGSRIGRGAVTGQVLRDRFAGLRQRRVTIKTRIVRVAGSGVKGARAHLRYIQREGVGRDGSPGLVYDAGSDQADPKAFLERGEDDRHQFRMIVSPEDAAEYEDLRDYTRRLMATVERDLGTKLDWVAVDHHNTGHPHSHVVVRGKDDQGKDLIIARAYITQGMRARAQEIASLDLGPRTDLEIENRLQREVDQERLTSLDRGLVREAGEAGIVDTRKVGHSPHARFRHALRVGRLRKLERLDLASEVKPGVFRLAEDLEPTLKRMGERGDIIRTMQRALAAGNIERGLAEYAIHDPSKGQQLVGRVVERGISDELQERHYLVVDATDGRSHYVEIGRADIADPIGEGSIVAIAPGRAGDRQVPMRIAVLSRSPLEQLTGAEAATWLDRELTAEIASPVRDAGFGHEVKDALARRRQWLMEQGLAEQREDGTVYRRNLMALLRRRELSRSAAALSGELGLNYVEARDGHQVEGVVRRRVDLVSGRYAVVQRSKEFTLVPWRRSLERGREVSGIVRDDDFVPGRTRTPDLPPMD